MAIRFRFEKKLETRERSIDGATNSNWNDGIVTDDLWRSIFTSGIRILWYAFRTERSSSLSPEKDLLSITSPTDTSSINSSPEHQLIPTKKHSQNVDSSSSILQQASKTFKAQTLGLTKEFQKNGLPWTGRECRSILAGGSGVLYCLPALCCQGDAFQQSRWLAQALLSVSADYIHVDQDSYIHGIDRIFATSNFVELVFQSLMKLRTTTAFSGIMPLAAFIMANRAKQQLNLEQWKYYHFLWHVISSLNILLIVYLLNNCLDDAGEYSTHNFLTDRFCLKSS